MKNIKVLGSGCKKCVATADFITGVAKNLDIAVTVTKETDPETIMNYAVMTTPAIVLDGQLVHSGSIPSKSMVEAWLMN